MRSGQKERLGVIRMVTAAIKQREVDERITLDDAQVAAMRFLHAVEDYPGLTQSVPVSGLPVGRGKTEVSVPHRPPTLG